MFKTKKNIKEIKCSRTYDSPCTLLLTVEAKALPSASFQASYESRGCKKLIDEKLIGIN